MIGGGPIAVELSQAFRRLGTTVTLLQQGERVLPRDEPELVDRLVARLRGEGVELRTACRAARVTVEDGLKVVHGTEGGAPARWAAEELLVAAGRRRQRRGARARGARDRGHAARRHGRRPLAHERRPRSTPSATSPAATCFTHSAASEGVKAIRDMFFPGKGRFDSLVPWATFSDPELAHAGLTIAEATRAPRRRRRGLAHGAGALRPGARRRHRGRAAARRSAPRRRSSARTSWRPPRAS